VRSGKLTFAKRARGTKTNTIVKEQIRKMKPKRRGRSATFSSTMGPETRALTEKMGRKGVDG